MGLMKLEDTYRNKSLGEIADLGLKTITPVHIGGGAEISANRFLLTEKVSAIVDEEKLFEKFSQRGWVDQYINQARQRQGGLGSFQPIQRMSQAEKEQFAAEVAAYHLKRFEGTPLRDIHNLRPFIRDGEHRAYIPGTSIKGAVRTAVLYGQLVKLRESNRKDFNAILAAIRNEVGRCRPSPNRPTLDDDKHTELIAQVLQGSSLQAPDRSISEGERSLFDVLKAFSISDTEPADFTPLDLCRIQIVSEGGEYGWHFSRLPNRLQPISIHAETLPENTILRCTGTVDKFTVNRFRPKTKSCFDSLKAVVAHMQRFTDDLIAFERGYFDHLYRLGNDDFIKGIRDRYDEMINSKEKPNIRIGWGCGLMGLTILTLLDRYTEDLVYAVRDRVFGNPQKYQGIKYFPKTRRFIVSEYQGRGNANEDKWEPIWPLGWCRLEQEGVLS